MELGRPIDANAGASTVGTKPSPFIAAGPTTAASAATVASIASAGFASMPETDLTAGRLVMPSRGINWPAIRAAATSAAAASLVVQVFALHTRRLSSGEPAGIAARYLGEITFEKGEGAVPEQAFGVAGLVWCDEAAASVDAFPEYPGAVVRPVTPIAGVPSEVYFDLMGADALMLELPAGIAIEARGI